MKELLLKLYLIVLVCIYLFSNTSSAQNPVTWSEAKTVACSISNKLFNVNSNADSIFGSGIARVKLIKYNNEVVGYIFCFYPKGYVVVPKSKNMRPYFTLTGCRTYEADKQRIENFIIPALIKNCMELQNSRTHSTQVTRNRKLWELYLIEN